ncbi:phage tail tape measure protein [Acinetobacter sp. ANC 5045]|uniref:phage tail tape measure protein n=1 Tax=Acinetobacter sp. ANC 5045 TaxID=2529851 RepID=UPI00103BBBB6|nr:phage tail tape measure protein [Acinetobacter sp. ANC 5045]TCB18975.1 phage tail tape measure protein [Acinetobacter sp. ANC 5045]
MAVGGALIGAGALIQMSIETAKADAQLQMLADRANTSVQNFQVLEQASLGFGVSQDQLGSILADVQEKLGEFSATEGGGAADFFDALKNNTKMTEDQIRSFAKTLQGKDGVEAIQLLNNKMDELGVTSQERRFVFESLASDLGNLAPLFAENGQLLEEYGRALEEAGVLKTKESIEQSRLLAAQTQVLDIQFQGMKNQLVSAVMPAVSNLMGLFVDTTNSAVGLDSGVSIVSIGMNAFAGVVVTAAGVLKTLFVISRESMVQLINVGSTLYGVVTAGSFSGAVDALKNGAGVVKQSWSAIADTALDSGKKAIDAFAGTASAQNKLTQAILKTTATSQQNSAGLKVNTKQAEDNAKAKEKSSKATSALSKAEREYNKVLEERERIKYDYASSDDQRLLDYQKEVQRLTKAGVSQEYFTAAKTRYEQEKKLISMQNDYDLVQHNLTDQQKLENTFKIKRQEIIADKKLSDDQRKLKIASLNQQYALEKKEAQLKEQKQLLETKKAYMSAEDYAREYYALVREEILNTAEYSPEMKNALVKQANIQQGVEENSKREQVWSDYQSMMGLEKSPYQQDIDLLAEARKQMLITEEEYQQQRLGMQMAYGAQYGADFAGMMMGLVDSSSTAYALLGGIQKGAALFSTAMNSYAAISAAWASAPFPYNLPAVGIATMETGLLQAAVSALSPVGYASGGYTGHGGKYDPAGIVHRGEGVLTQEEIAALGGPAGFYALRQSIKNGFADGGLVLDAPKLESPRMAATPKYLGQPTAVQQPNVNLNPNFVIVDEREKLGDYLYSPDGKKAFVKFFKQNRRELGFA